MHITHKRTTKKSRQAPSNLEVQDEYDRGAQRDDDEVEAQAVPQLPPGDGPQQPPRLRRRPLRLPHVRPRPQEGLALGLEVAHHAPTDALRLLQHSVGVQEAQPTPDFG